jgi:hypothetical protein
MVRRMFLAISFVVALGLAGLGMSNTAEAHGCGRGGYGGYYGAYYAPSYGVYPYVSRASYYPPVYYGPAYYGGYGRHRHHDGGLYISLGF